MKIRSLALWIALISCLFLFGCTPKAEDTDKETTTAPTEEAVEDLLPKDGYYVYEATSEAVYYMHLQDQAGAIYMMNVPTEFTLQDGLLFAADSEDGIAYTYKNEKFSFEIDDTRFSMKYVGDALPEKYAPTMPPAGSYAVSSISVNGDMQIYGEETTEILELSEDGSGTFLFAEQQHEILLQDGILLVDGEPIGFSYYPEGGDTPILMLLWAKDDAYTIALQPVME